MFQKTFSPPNNTITLEALTSDNTFYVLFPITRGEETTYISVKIKGAVAELSSIRSIVKSIVVSRLKEHGLKYYECESMEDFDMKFAIYRLTDDPDSFKGSHEES